MASPTFSVRWKGWKEYNRMIRLFPKDMLKAMDEQLSQVATLIWRGSVADAPVRTGFLASNIFRRRKRSLWYEVGVSRRVAYGGFVHDGTKNMRPRPFIQQNVQKHQNKILNVLVKWTTILQLRYGAK